MKKILIGIAIFLIGAFIIEMLIENFFYGDPDISRIVVDSIYRVPANSRKIGNYRESGLTIDSISKNGQNYFFSIEIRGETSDTAFVGEIGKSSNTWKILELKSLKKVEKYKSECENVKKSP